MQGIKYFYDVSDIRAVSRQTLPFIVISIKKIIQPIELFCFQGEKITSSRSGSSGDKHRHIYLLKRHLGDSYCHRPGTVFALT